MKRRNVMIGAAAGAVGSVVGYAANANDTGAMSDGFTARLMAKGGSSDTGHLEGAFEMVFRRSPGGIIFRREKFHNLVMTLGKNGLLTSGTTTTCFMGLISATSFSAIAASDTMASHPGWLEAGNANNPQYGTTGPRLTLTWAAAASGAIATSGTNAFVFSNSGTVQGGFITFLSGASATVGNTSGTLMNAGALASPQTVSATNTVDLAYTLTLT